MRKSIYSKNEIFRKCYYKLIALISEGIKVADLPSNLENEFLPNEIKLLLKDLGSVKYFKKVDKVQIVYRILSIIVLLQFIINFLLVVFFASLAKDSTSANIDFNYFSMSVFYSLGGLIIAILLVINSFWENIISTTIVLISFFFFSQIYNDAFIIFKTTSVFYWIPILIFISTFLLTVRLALPKRERMLSLLKRLKKNEIDIFSIPEELSAYSRQFDENNLLSSYSKAPDSKGFFKNLPYKAKKNPTENDLLNWVSKKKRNNFILLILVGIFLLGFLAIFMFAPFEKVDVYQMIQFIFGIGIWIYLFLKRESLRKIDNNYIKEAILSLKGEN